MANPRVVIAGAGPAGMVLAYQLASHGVPVQVLERHPDFEREFRGELIQASVLELLEQLGLMAPLVARGVARPGIERRLFVGKTRQVQVPGGKERGALISQAGFLSFLHEQCARFPSYRLDFGAAVTGVVREGGRVVAMTVGERRVEGDLFVVCTGRGTALRKEAGAELESFAVPTNVLWLRFDFADAKEALPAGVDVHMFGRGVVSVFFPTTGSRLQLAYSAPGEIGGLAKDVPALKRRLLPTVPDALRPHVERKLDGPFESQFIRLGVDRLKKWSSPGLFFIGDAAHTLSPSGGQGLNIAIRDAVVTANHLLDAIQAGQPLEPAIFERIEAERRPEVEQIQGMQMRVHRMVLAPLALEHVIFTMLGMVVRRMEKKGIAPPAAAKVEVKHRLKAGAV